MAMVGYSHEKLARAAKKIIVDIDEAEIGKLKTKIDVPICADAKAFIQELIKQSDKIKLKDRSTWIERCREWKTKYPVVLPEYWEQKDSVSSYVLSEILSQELTGDDLVVPGSSGFASELFLLCFKVKPGQRVFHTRGPGAMGFGLPASIGACIASGRKRTICVDGDGGFQLNIQELETVARLNLPIKFFVINNQGYASIRTSQRGYFGRLTGADATSGLTLPDTVKVASAYGVATARIVDQTNLRHQVREILNSPKPIVCEVMVSPDEPRAPRLASVQRPDGSMASKPLEDLWPFLDREEFLSNMIIPPIEE
jgi:acetolactate synthase-1/2/3 large subunit